MKIEKNELSRQDKIAEAFFGESPLAEGHVFTDGQAVFIHQTRVFQRLKDKEGYLMSLGGWDTQMTRRYINAVLRPLDASIFVKEGMHYLRVGNLKLGIHLEDVVFFSTDGATPKVIDRDSVSYKIFFPG